MSAARILHERTVNATVVRLNDPANRNRLDDGMVDELHAALDGADPNAVLAFRGNGDGFSAGRPHSPGGHPNGPAAAGRALAELVRLNLRIAQWPGPTLGFIHGYANGAALGLLQHMDIVVAARGTRCSFPEITYNLPPSLVASYLGRKVGEKPTRYLVMTGEEVDAERALEMGLISTVVAPDALDAEAERLLRHLGERLDAELAMKATLAEFSTYAPDLAADMERGVGAVMRWARRPKVGS
ncbi:MAG TPA: enoyl-CoA hydratase/isomerase family protein [Candidatus Lustribacter sp.]